MLFQNIVPKLNIGVLGCSSNLESLMSLPSVQFVRRNYVIIIKFDFK